MKSHKVRKQISKEEIIRREESKEERKGRMKFSKHTNKRFIKRRNQPSFLDLLHV